MQDETIRWIEQAQNQMDIGQLDGAMDTLRQLLGTNPDIALAHALLALCLLNRRRLYAANHEAKLALALEPELLITHYAIATVFMAKRKFRDAEKHIDLLLQTEPENSLYLRTMAELCSYTGREKHQQPLLEKALTIDPEDPQTLTALSQYARYHGSHTQAFIRAQQALTIAPEHSDALIAMGYVLLDQGKIDQARDHAIWVLRQDANDVTALALMAAIKARSSFVLGLWWRYNSWMGRMGEAGSIIVLLTAYIIYRVASLAAIDFGQANMANFIQFFWIALVIYSFVGPIWFRRSLEKEMRGVELKKDF